jgi:hypothetical protein
VNARRLSGGAADLLVKNGEVNVAYQVVGEGPHDLLMIPGWISHLAMEWEEPRLE